ARQQLDQQVPLGHRVLAWGRGVDQDQANLARGQLGQGRRLVAGNRLPPASSLGRLAEHHVPQWVRRDNQANLPCRGRFARAAARFLRTIGEGQIASGEVRRIRCFKRDVGGG